MRHDAKPFDATTKYLLEKDPAGWLECLGFPRPARASVVDADLATVTSEADKVIRADDPKPWIAHLELQAGRDDSLPDRLLRYNVLLRARHHLPIQTVIVLLRPEADFSGLDGTRRHLHTSGECYLEFRYRVIRVWDLPLEQVLQGPLAMLPLALLTNRSANAAPEVIRRMQDRLRQEAAPDEAALLWTATYILMGLRYPSELTRQLLQGVRAMKESVTYQAILQEGREVGLEEGRGEEAKRMLILLGSKRFGPPSAEISAAVDRINNVKDIEQLATRLLDVESWTDLLAG